MDQFKRSFIRSGVVLVRSSARVWGSNTQGWVKLFTGADVLNPDRQNSRFHLHKCKAVKKKPCSVFKSHNSDRAGKAVLKAGLSGSGGDVRWCGRRNCIFFTKKQHHLFGSLIRGGGSVSLETSSVDAHPVSDGKEEQCDNRSWASSQGSWGPGSDTKEASSPKVKLGSMASILKWSFQIPQIWNVY